jgi:hypothetical protein
MHPYARAGSISLSSGQKWTRKTRKNEKRREKYFPKWLMLLNVNYLPPDSTPTASINPPWLPVPDRFKKCYGVFG